MTAESDSDVSGSVQVLPDFTRFLAKSESGGPGQHNLESERPKIIHSFKNAQKGVEARVWWDGL